MQRVERTGHVVRVGRLPRLIGLALFLSLSTHWSLWAFDGDRGEIEPLVQRGRAQLSKRDFRGAAESFARAVRAAPDDGELSLLLGLAYFGCDRFQESISPLENSAKQLDRSALPHQFLGRALFQLERLDEAKAALERARKLDPEDAATLNQLGAVLLKQADERGALAMFEAAMRVDPAYGTAHFNAGVIEFLEGNAAVAKRHLERAAELMPDDPDVSMILGDVCTSMAKPHEARDWYEDAARRAPEAMAVVERAARANEAIGDLASAACYRDALVRGAPDDIDAWRRTATLALRRQDGATARRALERCVALEPQSQFDLLALADFLEDGGDLEPARERVRQALASDANDPELLRRLSRLCESTSDAAGARAAFERLVSDSDDAAGELRCVAERMVNSSLEGIRDLDLGHKLATALVERSGGRDAALLVLLAQAEARRGDGEKAASAYLRAAALLERDVVAARILRDRAESVVNAER